MLNPKKRYLQIALNSTLQEAKNIIEHLPLSERILLEAGTPLIKRYGEEGIRRIKEWYEQRMLGQPLVPLGFSQTPSFPLSSMPLSSFFKLAMKEIRARKEEQPNREQESFIPYVVADLKMMDRGSTEVEIAQRGGADAAVALGHAPIESLDAFVETCRRMGLDSMIDMMNVEFPLAILRKLKARPNVVILHRGVDEEHFNKQKQIPLHEIRRIKGNYDIMIAIAGGDTLREVQRSIFNDADIVVVWKSFYRSAQNTARLAEEFLKEIK